MAFRRRKTYNTRPAPRVELDLEVLKFSEGWSSTLFTDGTREVWIGKNNYWISDGRQGVDKPEIRKCYTISVPRWLAEKEELI